MQLRDYQDQLSTTGAEKLDRYGICYFSMEVRTGKTLTAIATAEKYIKTIPSDGKILVLTKKKAIGDIVHQYEELSPQIEEFNIINYESIHKLEEHGENLDVIILDEAHKLGAFPKMSKRTKEIRDLISKSNKCKVIFLSGTPTPESYSQIFHQLGVSKEYSPFRQYGSFYKWAKDYVSVKQKYVAHGNMVNDYSFAHKELIDKETEHLFIKYSQKDAGFSTNVVEEVRTVKMKDVTYHIANKLQSDLVVEGKEQTLIADTGVKLQSKLHQIYSGTVKFEDGSHALIDDSKAYYIADHFPTVNTKIAIFYKFKAELEILKTVFKNWTDDPEEFKNDWDKVFLGQIQSVREGINLSCADALIMYNIDFSAVSYWQGRDRLSEKNREKPNRVYWIFAEGGIEHRVYKAVMNKKDYTLNYFCKDFGVDKKRFKNDGTTDTKENNRPSRQGGLVHNETNQDKQEWMP